MYKRTGISVSKTILVSNTNLAETDIILLNFLLSVLEKQTAVKWCMKNDQDADIFIIDMQKTGDISLYKSLITSTKTPVIIGYGPSEEIKPVCTLSKPMRSSEFISLMKAVLKAHPKLGKEYLPEENKTFEDPESDTSYPEIPVFSDFIIKRPSSERLHNLLNSSQTQKKLIQIQYQNINLTIDFTNQVFYCQHRMVNLSELFKTDIHRLSITEIDKASISEYTHELTPQPLNELIWCSLLLGSCGEIDDRINEQTQLHMNQWPDFTSYLHQPEHILISACITKQTLTLQEIAIQTKTSVETVTDFINACLTLGFLDTTSKINSPVKRKKLKYNEQLNIFEKIRIKLGIKTENNSETLLIPFPSQQ